MGKAFSAKLRRLFEKDFRRVFVNVHGDLEIKFYPINLRLDFFDEEKAYNKMTCKQFREEVLPKIITNIKDKLNSIGIEGHQVVATIGRQSMADCMLGINEEKEVINGEIAVRLEIGIYRADIENFELAASLDQRIKGLKLAKEMLTPGNVNLLLANNLDKIAEFKGLLQSTLDLLNRNTPKYLGGN